MAKSIPSFVHKWDLLKREYQHLLTCPDKGAEVHQLFSTGMDYMQHHGRGMFKFGFIVGAVVVTFIIGLLNMIIVG